MKFSPAVSIHQGGEGTDLPKYLDTNGRFLVKVVFEALLSKLVSDLKIGLDTSLELLPGHFRVIFGKHVAWLKKKTIGWKS